MKNKLENFLISLGLDTFGFIRCRNFEELRDFYTDRQEKGLQNEFEESDIELRIRPNSYMEDAKTILSIAFPYYQEDHVIDNGFSIYTRRTDYHQVVHRYLERICAFLREKGYQAEGFVDSNRLPERYIAYLAGVGFIGKNNMIITKRYGSFVFLGEILTDLELPCDDVRTFDQIRTYAECGECNRCRSCCPTKSIHPVTINPNICLSYLTQKKALTDEEIALLGKNVFGCDYCQNACPYNASIPKAVLSDFATLDCMNEELETYAGMDNAFFKQHIKGTSCGWRGKNVIRRNAILRMQREGKEVDQYLGDSDYLNKYIRKEK